MYWECVKQFLCNQLHGSCRLYLAQGSVPPHADPLWRGCAFLQQLVTLSLLQAIGMHVCNVFLFALELLCLFFLESRARFHQMKLQVAI